MKFVLTLSLVLLFATAGADGVPPLVDAVKRGDHAAVRALLKNKSIVNQPEADGTTALHWRYKLLPCFPYGCIQRLR